MSRAIKRSKRRGAVAVEFALVLPLLLLALLGILDYGWYFYCSLNLTNAVREGARAGSLVVNGDPAGAQSTTRAYLSDAGLGTQPTEVTVTVSGAPTTITVDASMHLEPLVGFVPLPSHGGRPVARAHAAMRGVP